MQLRAQAVGEAPHIRFAILRVDDGSYWDGEGFSDEISVSRRYWHPADACATIQSILKEYYRQLPMRRFVVPIEIEVFGDVSQRTIAEYLHQASILSIRTEEFGNGPEGTYVAPVIHWGYITQIFEPARGQIDDLAAEWEIELGQEEDHEL